LAKLLICRSGYGEDWHIDPLIEEHGGRIANTAGDSLLLEFPSVVDAVRCSVAFQKGIAERNAGTDENQRIQFRVGIHIGDVVAQDADLLGDGVNVAARLEAVSEPGGITMSDDAYRQVRDRMEVAWQDGGDIQVKHIARPVHVWHWISGLPTAGSEGGRAPPSPAQDKPSIVVLPFDNMSGDVEQEYFSDGISEDVITDLSRVSGLLVIARNSAFAYKGKAVNVGKICAELGVSYALEGSVRKAGNRVRITAQLIDGKSGGHLWAERYDRELTDIFEVQDDVTQAIVGALKVSLSDSEMTGLQEGGTRNVEAHDWFLRGRGLLFGVKRDRDMFTQATACFRRAIEFDPAYAAPYAGLSMAFTLDHQNRWSDAPDRSLDRAGRFVDEAVSRDPKDPFAHYVSAMVGMLRKDYSRWAEETDRALALNPEFAPALSLRGILLIYSGKASQAIPYIERAMRLDPAFQQQYIHFLGTAYFVAGDYQAAATQFEDRISINPTTDLSRAFLASALGHLGRPIEARQIWDELMEINSAYSYQTHIGRLPFRSSEDAAPFGEGLKKAGLVD
jgi:adenylate cyclase